MAERDGSEIGNNGGSTNQVGSGFGGSDDVIRIDPGAIDTASGTAETVAARGGYGPNGRKLNKDGTERKAKGSGRTNASASAAQAPFPVDMVAAQIVAAHALLSFALKAPELALDPREGKTLAEAMANLQQFYPHVQIAPKTMAWGNMFSALGLVYGGRFLAIASKKKETRAPQSTADVIRPAQFQQPRTHVTPPPASPFVAMPDGDDLATPNAHIVPQGKPVNAAERAFSETPPEML